MVLEPLSKTARPKALYILLHIRRNMGDEDEAESSEELKGKLFFKLKPDDEVRFHRVRTRQHRKNNIDTFRYMLECAEALEPEGIDEIVEATLAHLQSQSELVLGEDNVQTEGSENGE